MKISAAVDPQFRRFVLPLLRAHIAIGCLLLAWITATPGRGEAPHRSTLGERVAPLHRYDLRPLTAASCASSSCHSGPRPGITVASAAGRAAYPLWLGRDPHARSWKTLCGPESVAIMTRLGILEGDRITDQAGWDNCLACHNTYRSEPVSALPAGTLPEPNATPVRLTFAPSHTEGVGCAACHGPAEQWIGQHFLAGWQGVHATDQGFIANDDLVTRARMCASCHVGDHDRDLNHDLIAAGHPVLRFEMASHHSRLPKHWRDPGADDRAGFEARLWSAGAVASADAWLALQQGRAQHSTAVSTWPELAAFDCSACHQSLRLNSDRNPLSDPSRRGSAKVARWDLAPVMLWAHADLTSADRGAATAAAELLSRLKGFRSKLEVMPAGSAIDVSTAAAEARQQLAIATAIASRSRGDRGVPRGLDQRNPTNNLLDLFVRSAPRAEATQTWEAAAQLYLLLAASQSQWPRGIAPELQEQAQQMRLGLALPDGLDSPHYSLAAPLGPELTREELRKLVHRIVATLQAEIDSLPPPVAATSQRSDRSRFTGPSALLKAASHASVH